MKNLFNRIISKDNIKATIERGKLEEDIVFYLMVWHYDCEVWIPVECKEFYFDFEESVYALIDYCEKEEIEIESKKKKEEKLIDEIMGDGNE